ncbi:MAG: ribose-phosphate pyrophosphokinase [Planctomycetes bacterium]|nr:ribose-phosphate pyrophosphokinase [Planctomycetota bacterium]
MQVFSGNAHRALASEICEYLHIPLGRGQVARFPDGEIDVKVENDVRGVDVFVIQPTCPPVNESLMELLILIDCFRRASTARITAVIPYFGYARKDRKDEGRVPITAKLVANLLTEAGVDRILTIDLHATQIQGFFDIHVDHLFASPVLSRYFQEMAIPKLVVASSDVGGVKMARAYAKLLGGDLAIVDKRRGGPERTEVMNIIGEVRDRNVLLIDDMISTAGTITDAAVAIKRAGALDVYLAATHPVLCGEAMSRLRNAPVQKVVVTNTIPLGPKAAPGLIEVLSVAPLLGEAMRRIHLNQSVSALF